MTRMLVGRFLAAVMAAAPSAQSRKAALVQARVAMRNSSLEKLRPGENTTIGLIATNAKLTKAQVKKVADMAHDGFARAMVPAHTMGDGDTIFAIATGRPNIPAVRDLRRP